MSVQRGGRQILLHGIALMLFGLVWGLAVRLTPYPRLALAAHIQFVTSGLLFIVLATILLTLRHRVGPRSIWVMVLSAWVTWSMGLSEVANAWWGTREMLPLAASQAGATGGVPWQEWVVKVTHVSAGISLIVAWTLLVVGFAKDPAPGGPRD